MLLVVRLNLEKYRWKQCGDEKYAFAVITETVTHVDKLVGLEKLGLFLVLKLYRLFLL